METKDAVQMAYDGNVSGFKETINSIETQNAGLEWELQQKLDAKGNPQPPHFFDEHIHQIDGSVATVQRRERCGNQKDVVCAMPFSC